MLEALTLRQTPFTTLLTPHNLIAMSTVQQHLIRSAMPA